MSPKRLEPTIPFFHRLWKQHARFYVGLLAGLLAWAITRFFDRDIAPIAGGDVFFLVYVVSMWAVARQISIDKLRWRANLEDEGLRIIVAVTAIAISFSFASIFMILQNKATESTTHMLLALLSIPLGWMTLQTLLAFHYARLFYAPTTQRDGKSSDAGGLDFPGTPEPGIWEFLYFSCTIGATFQTSDVAVRSTDFRLVVLFHTIASFVFNTVLLALAVNVGATLVT